MLAECLTITFSLPGCQSLKEKRQRLSGLKYKIGRTPEIAVIESGSQDSLGQAEWSFFVVAHTRAQVDSIVQSIEKVILEQVDARIIDIHKERL